MKKLTLIMSLIAMMFISCEGGFGEGNTDFGNITLDENCTELLNQTVTGDALTCSGITFTATAPWSATVQEVRSEASWLTFSPDHGEAGTYTLEIILEANTTGTDRTAEIVISCNGSTMKIKITQKATEQVTPSLPVIEEKNRITAISSSYNKRTMRSFFTYNDKGEIAEVRYEDIYDDKYRRSTTQTINYDGRNVTISEKSKFIREEEFPQEHNLLLEQDNNGGSAILNSDGTLSSLNYGEYFQCSVSYDKNGRIDKYTNISNGEAIALFTWEDGNLTSIYTDELEATITISYSEIDNVWGGVDWFWLLLNDTTGDEIHTIFSLLNKNGGMHTKKLPKGFSFEGETLEFTYTFNERGQLESVSFFDETLEFGYAEDAWVGYSWPEHVTHQEVINYYNKLNNEGEIGYTRNCVVRTYSGKENYFDTTFTQSIVLRLGDPNLFVGPEYKTTNVSIDNEDVYYNALYRGFYIEPYTTEWDTQEYYAYYDFTTFSARHNFGLDIRGESTPWKYNLTTGEKETIEWQNEEWMPYFNFKEIERSKGGLYDGTDEYGNSGKTQMYYIQYDMYVTLASKNADPKYLNYTLYNWYSISFNHWIPNQQ